MTHKRYAREEMSAIWSLKTKYRICLDIELYACEAMAKLGLIPESIPPLLWERAKNISFDTQVIEAIEEVTKHDFLAFLTFVGKYLGPEARYLHWGLTTSDIQDTCVSVQILHSSVVLLESLDALLAALERQAHRHKNTLCIGRTHGIHAEPTTFGLKMAGAYAEFQRHKKRLEAAVEESRVCALSGAVGTYAHVDPFVENYVAQKLGLFPEIVSTQVIPRDRYAVYFARLGIMAGSIERLATEIRSLQRTEIGEVEEFFSEGQKGSSAMPHKRNPVLSENLVGLSRMLRGMAFPVLENIALWHERDISHSSVERMIFPDANILADFALRRLANVIENLTIKPERMCANIDMLGGLIYSQRVLLALVNAGLPRDDAYLLVQGHAKKVWDAATRTPDMFLASLQQDASVTEKLPPEELAALFKPEYYVRRVDIIYGRLFQKELTSCD